MPIVKMPDGTMVEMPDNPSPEQIAKLKTVIGQSYQKEATNTALDIGKSAGSGVVRGVESLGKLLTGVVEAYGKAAAPQTKADLSVTQPEAEKAAAVNAPVTQPTEVLGNLAESAGANYTPQTAPGRYAKSVGEQVPAFAFGSASVPLKALGATGAGVGAEAGNQAMGGDSNLGKFMGGLAGGLAAPAIAFKAQNAKEILAEALQGLSKKDFENAKGVAKTLSDANLPYLASQTFQTPTTLPSIMARVAENPSQGPRLLRFLEGVPDATEAAIATKLAKLAPVGGGAAARDVAQETAEARLKQLGQQASAEYTKNMPQGFNYDKQQIKALYDDLLDLSYTMGETSQAGQYIARKAAALKYPDTGEFVRDSNAINQLYKELGAGFPDIGKLSSVEAARVKDIFKAATPEFDEARKAFSTFKDEVVNPTKKSLTGQIATQGGGPQVDKVTRNELITKLTFPLKDAQPAEIRKLANDMRLAGNPEAFNGLAANYVEQAMQTAFKGKSINSPAKFVDSVYGTNAQKVNLTAAVEEMAKTAGYKPALVSRGFKRFFEALDSYKNLEIKHGVSQGQLMEDAGKTVSGALLSPRFVFRRWKERTATDKAYAEIADIMMSPDGLAKLEKLSTYSPNSRAAMLLVSDLMGAVAGTQTDANSAPSE